MILKRKNTLKLISILSTSAVLSTLFMSNYKASAVKYTPNKSPSKSGVVPPIKAGTGSPFTQTSRSNGPIRNNLTKFDYLKAHSGLNYIDIDVPFDPPLKDSKATLGLLNHPTSVDVIRFSLHDNKTGTIKDRFFVPEGSQAVKSTGTNRVGVLSAAAVAALAGLGIGIGAGVGIERDLIHEDEYYYDYYYDTFYSNPNPNY